jgi:hypothetical protein
MPRTVSTRVVRTVAPQRWFVLSGVALALALAAGCSPGPATPAATGSSPASAGPSASPSPSASATPSASPPDATAGWTSYSDTTDRYSLRYPPSWVRRICHVSGHANLYLAPSTAALGVCNSDFVGQMSVLILSGDQRAALHLSGSTYTGLVTSSVTVDGVIGQRQVATVAVTGELGPVAGTHLEQYLFFVHGRTYRTFYSQAPSGATATDVRADFELMVEHTLRLTP